MTRHTGYRRLLRLWETDYGRSEGWRVELAGQHVATLSDPQDVEMFWMSYRLEVVTLDRQIRDQLLSEEFWKGEEWANLVLRSCATGDIAEHWFPSAQAFAEPGNLIVRGLYIHVRSPLPWDRLLLLRRRPARAPLPPTKVLVIIEHPYGTAEVPLERWIAEGPGHRPLLQPVAAKCRETGQPLGLSVIPLRYRNNWLSRFLIHLGVLADPWPR